MTKKRFTSKIVDWWHNINEVRVVFDNGEWIDAYDCAKLLNALYEENQQLKKENEQSKQINKNNEKYKCHICKHLHNDKTLKLYCDINGVDFLKKFYDCENFEDYRVSIHIAGQKKR